MEKIWGFGLKNQQSLYILAALYTGVSPSGKAADSDSAIRWFKSIHPSHFSRSPFAEGCYVKRFLLSLCVLLASFSLAQAPAEEEVPHFQRDNLSTHPAFDFPGFVEVELSPEELRGQFVQGYLVRLSDRAFAAGDKVKWVAHEFGVSRSVAEEYVDYYSGLIAEVSQYAIASGNETCALSRDFPASLSLWATRENQRRTIILTFFEKALDHVDQEISSELAEQLKNGVASISQDQTIPVRRWVVNVSAGDGDLFRAHQRTCHPDPVAWKLGE